MSFPNIQLDKQKKILIIIFVVLFTYVDLNYVLKAQTNGLKSADTKIARLNSDLTKLNKDLASMRLANTSAASKAEKTSLKSSKLLAENQISGLLQDIASSANKFNVKIFQIRPNREVQANTNSAPGQDKLTGYLINLDLICDYHNLGRFINALENSLVYMGIQELKIVTQLPDYMKQKVTLVVKTYVIK